MTRRCKPGGSGLFRLVPISACPYVYLDARYERVRQGGLVQKAAVLIAVLIAVGVDESGKRCVLGVSVALSEHEVHLNMKCI